MIEEVVLTKKAKNANHPKARAMMTLAEFKQRAKTIHRDKYDYSDTVIKGSKEKITIKCPNHGEFLQVIYNHLNGVGCPKCYAEGRAKFTQAEFEERANIVHGNRYDYSNAVYKNTTIKIKIGCRIHGEFTQLAGNHLNGSGCKECNNKGRIRLTQAEFEQKAKAKHGDKYDYSNSVYTGSNKKITIGCRTHGEFSQYASSHINGSGCPKCCQGGKSSKSNG